jgi:hypothetical protein
MMDSPSGLGRDNNAETGLLYAVQLSSDVP